MPFISFSCLIALVRTSSTMLNRSGESRHPCLQFSFISFFFFILSSVNKYQAQFEVLDYSRKKLIRLSLRSLPWYYNLGFGGGEIKNKEMNHMSCGDIC